MNRLLVSHAHLRLAFCIIGLSAAAATASADGPTLPVPPLDSPTQTYRDRFDHADSASVLAMLREGNHRFASGASTLGGQGTDQRERRRISAQGQRGVAVVLSCIDSRVAPEFVFDSAVGDLYTVRVGANVVGDDQLGSIEVAVASGAKVIVVMGHTRCAGVRAACMDEKLEHFTGLIAKVRPAIDTAQSRLAREPALAGKIGGADAGNPEYIRLVSELNADAQAHALLRRSRTIREAVKHGETLVIPALYDVDNGEVKFNAPIPASAADEH